ncbi:hypothetical protein GALL_468460 [mine drainage metagenome]|uniref:Uncharacterized protein n=1 Tax=mine drainage metagenome TaxID=410659 RepID=A0A1J5PL41_9ZZZZ
MQKTLLQRNGHFFGKTNTDKATRGQCVTVMNQGHRFSCTDDLVLPGTGGVQIIELGVHAGLLNKSGCGSCQSSPVPGPWQPLRQRVPEQFTRLMPFKPAVEGLAALQAWR